MKKVMVYCQYSAGTGCLVRSTEIVRSLAKEFEVCFINGGQVVSQFELPSDIKTVYLPGLREAGSRLIPTDRTRSLAEVKTQRQQQLHHAFSRFAPDCLITECFPFSKRRLSFELLPLLEDSRRPSRRVSTVCSLGDCTVTPQKTTEAQSQQEEKVCQLIDQFYDAVFFHTDEQFQTLSDDFSQVKALNCSLTYTGYVARSPQAEKALTVSDLAGLTDRTPSIVVSAGDGKYGYPLLSAVVEASSLLACKLPHKIYIFAGPFMPARYYSRLKRAARRSRNVTLRRHTPRLADYLRKAALSVSLGDYATTLNVLETGARSLVLPAASRQRAVEQRRRAEKLSSLGVLGLLEPEDLLPERLVAAILTQLQQTPAERSCNLQGADNTARSLKKLLVRQATIREAA